MRCFFRAFPDISGNALKKLFYNNKMQPYAELMKIPEASEIRGYFRHIKSKFIALLIKKRLISETYVTIKQEKAV